jgi:hypothetical protein
MVAEVVGGQAALERVKAEIGALASLTREAPSQRRRYPPPTSFDIIAAAGDG